MNICGIYELPDRYIKFDLDLKQSELDQIKQKFMEDNKFIFIDGWVKIINHDIYNKFIGEKNEKAKEKEMALIPQKVILYQRGIEGVSTNGDTLNIHNHKSIINNSINNQNQKEKKKYMDVVFLTKEEYQKLIDKFGKDITEDKIEELNNSIMSKGYKYKSHYHTILCWDRKNKKGDINGKNISNNQNESAKDRQQRHKQYKNLEEVHEV